jgi:hypothetical protein
VGNFITLHVNWDSDKEGYSIMCNSYRLNSIEKDQEIAKKKAFDFARRIAIQMLSDIAVAREEK